MIQYFFIYQLNNKNTLNFYHLENFIPYQCLIHKSPFLEIKILSSSILYKNLIEILLLKIFALKSLKIFSLDN